MRPRVRTSLPDIGCHHQPFIHAVYPIVQGVPFKAEVYDFFDELQKQTFAKQLAEFMHTLHSVPKAELQSEGIILNPSWSIEIERINEKLSQSDDFVINALLPIVIKNHTELRIPDEYMVFGHFDLHGGNLLIDKQGLSGVIDFGNCKFGDIHQDFSTINLSSPQLTAGVIDIYEKISGRLINRLLVQHYTTLFYLNLLASLKADISTETTEPSVNYNKWLKRFHDWYHHLYEYKAKDIIVKQSKLTGMTDAWKAWLAASLIKGVHYSDIRDVLRSQNFTELEIATEILAAETHPYFNVGKEMFHELDKRNWLLNTCHTLAALDSSYNTKIDVVETPAFDEFIKKYYSKHLPVVLKNGINHWKALDKWSPRYLANTIGDAEIEIQYGRDSDSLFERNAGQHKKNISMSHFVDLIESSDCSNDFYMTANNTKHSINSILPIFDDLGDFSEGYRHLTEDNAFATHLWIGPKGTFTPLHHDLTNNMLVQIYGRKKVTLIPAWQVPWLYNDKGVYTAANFPDFDKDKHPHMSKATPVEVILEAGDAIFIPIAWWHCVESLTPSINISFTNFNVPNQFSHKFPRT